MRRVKFSMPSPAMVVACVALIAALGGTAYAALGKNSVKSKQIAPKAVKTSDLANGAVTGQKLKDGAVAAADLLDGSIGTDKLADGAVTNAKLAPLSVKLANLGVVVDSYFQDATLPDDGTKTSVTAQCPAGTAAVSGGYSFAKTSGAITPTEFTSDFKVIQSRPTISPAGFPDNASGFDGWRVTAINDAGGPTGTDAQITAMVVCLRDR